MSPKDPTAIDPKGAHTHSKRAGRSPHGVRPRKGWPRGFRAGWPLLALLGLSLAIRLWGVNHRLPDPSLGVEVVDDSALEETDRTTMGRAWALWEGGTKPLDLNPHTGGWPSLSFYLSLLIQYLYRAYFFLAHPGATAADFVGGIAGQAVLLFLVARIAGVLIGVATVYLTYRLGSRYLGRPVGLIAGLLVGTNTLHILTSQHISDPNLLALLFVLLATESMIRIRQGGGVSESIRAGVMIGLAGACKYVPLVLAFPFALAHRRDAGAALDAAAAGSRTPLLKNRAFWYGLLAIPTAVFIASPFLFLDWKRTLIDILNQRDALFSDWVGQTVFPISLPAYLGVSLPHAMGWPAYLLGLVGLVPMWRSGPTARVLVLIPTMIVLANGLLKSPQERYVLVALPYLHIGAAFTIVRVAEWGQGRISSLERIAPWRLTPMRFGVGVLAAAAIAWPLPELVATRHSLSLPDSRHLSRRWVNENLDPNKPVAIELYGPVFYDKERPVVTWPFFATQSELVRPAYHPEFLDGLEYYVASGEISRRFGAKAEHYPVENAYYRWFRENTGVVWESDPKKTSGPRIAIRRLPRSISTRAQRDSIFAAAMPKPTEVERLDLWCVDCSRLFARSGDYDRAEEWARRGLRVGVKAREPQLRCALAIALWYKGQLDSAETEARLAVQGGPQSGPFHLYHGVILADMGRFDAALAEFRNAFELSGRDPQIRLSIAETLGHLGRFDEAVQELRQIPPGHPDRARALRDAAALLFTHPDRRAETLALLRESIQLDPNQPQADLARQQIAQLEAELGP